MIEPSGTRITLPPNRQSKVPGLGANQAKGQKQDSYCVAQAQDDKGFGTLTNAGISDNVPGMTMHATKQAQDAGSVQAGIPDGGPLNKGKETSTSVNFRSPHYSSSKAQGQQPKPGRGDIGVAPGMLFPGIVE